MPYFQDSKGNDWELKFTVATLKRIRELTDINLGYIDAAEMKKLLTFQDLATISDEGGQVDQTVLLDALDAFGKTKLGMLIKDPESIGEILYAVLQRQAEARKIDKEAFLDLLDQETIDRGSECFWETYANFFHKSRTNTFQRMAYEVVQAYRSIVKMADQMDDGQNKPNPSISGRSSTKPQASLESSQTSIPSANST